MCRNSTFSFPSMSLVLGVSIVLLVGCSISPIHAHTMDEMELQKIFQLRNEDDWKKVWHSETYARCRDQLLTHMDWACQKDIYRIDKKMEPNDDDALDGIFIGKKEAHSAIKPWSGYVFRNVINGCAHLKAYFFDNNDFADKSKILLTCEIEQYGTPHERKRENKSIMDECCTANGCTWEEYAEYCPAHRRVRVVRSRLK